MTTTTETRLKLPAELRIEDVVAIIDQNEGIPLDLSPMKTIVRHLYTGDYTLAGWEEEISIERKSLTDLVACVTGDNRKRFDKEILRLRGYATRALIVEATWGDVRRGGWRSNVTPASVEGSLRGWEAKGIPLVMAGTHEVAGRYVQRMLYMTAKRKWRAARQMMGLGLKSEDAA